jgi:hypothetical protein
MRDRALKWFIIGANDWDNKRIFNPPVNKKDFKNYCDGYDYVMSEDAAFLTKNWLDDEAIENLFK